MSEILRITRGEKPIRMNFSSALATKQTHPPSISSESSRSRHWTPRQPRFRRTSDTEKAINASTISRRTAGSSSNPPDCFHAAYCSSYGAPAYCRRQFRYRSKRLLSGPYEALHPRSPAASESMSRAAPAGADAEALRKHLFGGRNSPHRGRNEDDFGRSQEPRSGAESASARCGIQPSKSRRPRSRTTRIPLLSSTLTGNLSTKKRVVFDPSRPTYFCERAERWC